MKFSETEQKIIRKIVNYDWSSLSTLDNFIGKELHFDLIIQPSDNLYWLYYSVNRGLDGKQERLLDFFNLYFLIKRLLKNDLLIIASGKNDYRFVGSQEPASSSGKIGKFEDGSYIDVDGKWKDKNNIIIKDFIPFPETKLPFGEMICGFPLISQELKDLVNNDFKSEEERRFAKQQRLTWISIIIAGLIGLGSLIINMIMLLKQ